MNAVIVGAGQNLNLLRDDYQFLNVFVKKLRLMGIDSHINRRSARNPMSLYQLYTEASPGPDFLFVVDQMDAEEDIAKALITDWFSLPLVKNDTLAEEIMAHCREHDITPNAILNRYAYLPQDAILIRNPTGLAQGFIIYNRPLYVVVLPHNPHELASLLENCIVPVMMEMTEKVVSVRECCVFGMLPGRLEQRLEELFRDTPICYECTPGEYGSEVHLTAYGSTPESADFMAESCIADLLEQLSPYASQHDVDTLAKQLGDMVSKQKITITVAQALRDIPAFREMMQRYPGLFSYVVSADRRDVKEKALGVPPALLNTDRANFAIAMHMARGMREIDKTTVGLAALLADDLGTLALSAATEREATSRMLELPQSEGLQAGDRWIQAHILSFCTWALSSYPDMLPEAIPVGDIPDEEQDMDVVADRTAFQAIAARAKRMLYRAFH